MSKEPRTSELLHQLLAELPQHEPKVLLSELLEQFGPRAFGVFVLVVVLPSFIPVAFGMGAVAGVLCVICGLQMFALAERPWLPRFARDFALPRDRLANFARRCEPWFRRLERLVKPRLNPFTEGFAARFTGLVVIVMGVALSLPIPFTNFLFAAPLTLLAIGIIEDDGALIVLSWLLCAFVLGGCYFLGEAFVQVLFGWFQ